MIEEEKKLSKLDTKDSATQFDFAGGYCFNRLYNIDCMEAMKQIPDKSSFDSPTRIVVINRVELLKDGTFHPTQKPVKLYEWLLSNYAATGDKIIDTHAGSGASCVACHNMRFEWMAFEIDPEYYKKADKRIKEAQAQLSIFDFMGGGTNWDR